MRHLVTVIWVMVVLGAVVSGCDDMPRHDSRLTAVDSLLRGYPDSALTLVEAVSRDSLPDEGDRAYRDLLLTQARYRCYVPATSDSDINRALAWFRAHPAEREKLTRALIYKGAVMEEIGHPDSAMLYYKQAEANADPDDYFNLGYSKLRIGTLYRDHYSMEGRHIRKIEEALSCFRQTDNQYYQLITMINLGSLYCLNFPLKADSILNQALFLAFQNNDTINYLFAVQNLIKNHIHQKEFEKAHRLIQKSLNLNLSKADNSFFIYAAYIYAQQQLLDSAQLFLSVVKNITNDIDELSYYETMRVIALSRGDKILSSKYEKLVNYKTDSLQAINKPLRISETEDYIDNKNLKKARKEQARLSLWIRILILASVLFAIWAFTILRRKRAQKLMLNEFIESSNSQLMELKQLQDMITRQDVNDAKLKEFINSYMVMMNEMIEECYHHPNVRHMQRLKDTIKYQNNKEKWVKLFDYLDIEYDNIITQTKKRYPKITEKDLLLIGLSAMDFSCIQIAMILGYANATTISGIRLRLAKKMGLSCSLLDYIDRFKTH